MINYQIQLPENIDLDESSFRFLVASKLLEVGKLSMSQAAELSGISYREFMTNLAKNDVQWLNYQESSLTKDVEAIQNYFS